MAKCGEVVETFVMMNNAPNNSERVNGKNRMVAVLVSLAIFALINLVAGPYLWNEVMRKLVPACGKARWFDTVALSILLGLILPQ